MGSVAGNTILCCISPTRTRRRGRISSMMSLFMLHPCNSNSSFSHFSYNGLIIFINKCIILIYAIINDKERTAMHNINLTLLFLKRNR